MPSWIVGVGGIHVNSQPFELIPELAATSPLRLCDGVNDLLILPRDGAVQARRLAGRRHGDGQPATTNSVCPYFLLSLFSVPIFRAAGGLLTYRAAKSLRQQAAT